MLVATGCKVYVFNSRKLLQVLRYLTPGAIPVLAKINRN